jgi:hypothetical protein
MDVTNGVGPKIHASTGQSQLIWGTQTPAPPG